MLELKNITKIYGEDGVSPVTALNSISVRFRESEFVSVLGPSGCGKTTMLNIIGGLDRYTEGQLLVDGVDTSNYKDRDWDTYRNRKIGFVFQSYNLIAHQTVLENVELALTLSGVNGSTRKEMAMRALDKVGLAKHLRKKPSELSGGEMQRVAIARAIVNDPEIILADEPTGALDSKTSVQIMDLLKEISKDKLVIMVTHNDSLANEYSTRIIKLLDSKIILDTNPYDPEKEKKPAYSAVKGNNKQKDNDKKRIEEVKNNESKNTSMSFSLALSLSLKNLLTKKRRTFLTSLASSIGIIGLALVLALFNGLNIFLDKAQNDTLSAQPMYVQTTNGEADIEQIISIITDQTNFISNPDMKDKIFISHLITQISQAQVANKVGKEYLDYVKNTPKEYLRDINYTYGTSMNIYKKKVVFDTTPFGGGPTESNEVLVDYVKIPAGDYFKQLIDDKEFILSQYEIVAGKYPEKANELCLVLDKNNRITDAMLVAFLMDINATQKDENGNFLVDSYEYEDFLGELQPDGTRKESKFGTFTLALNNGLYVDSDKNGLYEIQQRSIKDTLNAKYGETFTNLVYNQLAGFMGNNLPPCYSGNTQLTLDLNITCIMRLKDTSTTGAMGAYPIGYTSALTDKVLSQAADSNVVKDQQKEYEKLTDNNPETICTNVLNGKALSDEKAYLNVLKNLGYAEIPTRIEFYPTSFENKVKLKQYLAEFNNLETTADNEKVYVTDIVSTVIDILKTLVDTITYILLALTGISLVVAAIMIAIITYVSVIERTREIGVLRAIGARKIDVTSVFNAETIIIGLVSGVLGILLALILQFPLNAILYSYTGIHSLVALSPIHALLLVAVSILVTLLSGMIPAIMASRRDPVKALRSE
ncbi:MAG: ATP-binding cassette domain-containing protein [Clostridia bacterium]|nr:ATP-binding cassette domain-containing protein [Clostridia bacterium]